MEEKQQSILEENVNVMKESSEKSAEKKEDIPEKSMSVEENLKGLDDLLVLVNKYKDLSEKLSNKGTKDSDKSIQEGKVERSSHVDKIEILEKEIMDIKNLLQSILQKSSFKEESLEKKNEESKQEDKSKSTKEGIDLGVVESTIGKLKEELTSVIEGKVGDLKSKIDEISDLSKKLAKERQESLALRRQELLQKYGLEDFADFVPDPLEDPNVTERDIVEAIAKIYNKEIVRSGLGELKKKYDLAKSKENYVDLNKMSLEDLKKYRNKLLSNMNSNL